MGVLLVAPAELSAAVLFLCMCVFVCLDVHFVRDFLRCDALHLRRAVHHAAVTTQGRPNNKQTSSTSEQVACDGCKTLPVELDADKVRIVWCG